MPTDEMPARLLEALSQHLPENAAWIPIALLCISAAGGLLLMFRGARLAPVVVAGALTAVGCGGGWLASQAAGWPLWPAVGAGSVVGLLLGLLLFRVWLAVQVATMLVAGGLALYAPRVAEPLNEYLSQGLQTAEDQALVTLQPAEAVPVDGQAWQAELGDLWAYLGERVPSFQSSVVAIVGAVGLAGLLFGLLLPRAARSFWAATVGTGCFIVAVMALLQALWPATLAAVGSWGLIIVAGLWGISLAWNLADMLRKRPKKSAADEGEPAAA